MSAQPVQYHTLVRTIATARIVLPTTIIRLAAGRQTLDESKQAMCFMAGANAVFTGEQMLTTPCECVGRCGCLRETPPFGRGRLRL